MSDQDSLREQAHNEHVAYWKANSEEGDSWQSAKDRFDAGFNKGWEDKGNGQNDENAAEAAHKQSAGDHPREWQFVHGYRSGQSARQ